MKTIMMLFFVMLLSATTASGQKNAGTTVPNMGVAFANGAVEGVQFNSTKVATVTTTSKTYTIITKDQNPDNYKNGVMSYVSPKKDTLVLQKDEFGFLIKDIWDNDTKVTKKPTIIMVSSIYNYVEAKKKKQPQVIKDKTLKN